MKSPACNSDNDATFLCTIKRAMRPGDLLGLAFASLRQRKLRTSLTLLGVVIGTVLMLLTLSGGLGVSDAVANYYRGSERMRTIRVDVGQTPDPSGIPAVELELAGNMSDARRERLRKALESRHPLMKWKLSEPMTPDRFDEWDRIGHVESLRPQITLQVDLWRGDDSRTVTMAGGPAGYARLEETIVEGAGFSADDAPEALIHEYIAYQWGFHDEASLDQLIGQTVRVEYFSPTDPLLNSIRWASRGEDALSPEEVRQTAQTLRRLAAAAESFGVPREQAELIQRALLGTEPESKGNDVPEGEAGEESSHRESARMDAGPQQSREFRVVGVFRTPEQDHYPWESGLSFLSWADVIVPMKTARDFIRPIADEAWIQDTLVLVDSEDHIEPVQSAMRKQGYQTGSMLEFVREVQQKIVYITTILAGLAFAAVAVAGLGIANTMAMTVLERTREIGVMKAVGARDGQILALFLSEGAMMGFAGSAIGLVAGWGVTFLIRHEVRRYVEGDFGHSFDHPLFVFPLWLPAGLLALVTALTTVASLLPARRAARIDPIQALRTE
jgi:putative ABC transport system permease protein